MSKGGYHTVLPNVYEPKGSFSFITDTEGDIGNFLKDISSYLTISLISQTLLILIIILFFILGTLKVRNYIKSARLNSYKTSIKKEIKKMT